MGLCVEILVFVHMSSFIYLHALDYMRCKTLSFTSGTGPVPAQLVTDVTFPSSGTTNSYRISSLFICLPLSIGQHTLATFPNRHRRCAVVLLLATRAALQSVVTCSRVVVILHAAHVAHLRFVANLAEIGLREISGLW